MSHARRITSWLERHPRAALTAAVALGIVAVLLSGVTLITRTQVATDKANQALQESRDDNRDLCSFLVTTADALDRTRSTQPTTPAGVQFRNSFEDVANAARAAAASPDCPK